MKTAQDIFNEVVRALERTEDETLEDVFIRLVGRSIEDVERLSDEGVTDDSEE